MILQKDAILTLVIALALLAVWPSTLVNAQPAPDREPGGAAMIAATGTATVQAIDSEKRTVTLKTPDGATAIVRCGPNVVNFDQIKVGDQVHATVLDRLVVYVGKPGGSGVDDGLMIARAPKGAKPGVIICETTTVREKVDAVDVPNRTVTLQGAEGSPHTLRVAPDVDLSGVNAGDELVVQYTHGLALMVEKPAADAQPAAHKVKPDDAARALIALTAKATVASIDAKNRLVTLKDSEGHTRTIHLGKECINFDQIRVGDQVKATLVEEIAVAVGKPGALPASDVGGAVVARAPEGSKPAVVIADTTVITARIDVIDTKNRTVRLIPADGQSRTIKVGPNVNLSALNPGDEVAVQCTQGLAIVVEAP